MQAEETQKDGRARITVVLTPEMLAQIKRMAQRKATPPSILVRQWIAEQLERDEASRR